VYCSDLTQITARAAEAHAASEAEKALLGLGIDRLAAKYWKNDNNYDSGGGHGIVGLQRSGGARDPLDEAAKLLMMEEENKNEERGSDEPVASEDILVEVGGDSEVEEVKEEEVIPPEYLPETTTCCCGRLRGGGVAVRSRHRVVESLAIYKRA